MPNEDLDAGLADVTAAVDSGPSDGDIDAMVVVSSVDCHEFDPNDPASLQVLGLTQQTASDVQLVFSGRECKPIYLSPALTAECDGSEPISVQSTLQFEGTLFVMERQGGFTLNDGQLLYKAVKGSCGEFPETQIKAIGLKFKPAGLSDSDIQVKLESGDYGELLARVHIWTGEGSVQTIEGHEIIKLLANQQALISQGGKVLETIEFDPGRQHESVPATEGDKQTEVPHSGNRGCDTTPSLSHGIDPIMIAVLILLMGRGFQDKIRKLMQ